MKKIAKNKDMLRLVMVMLGSILLLLCIIVISNHNNIAILAVMLAVFVIGLMLYFSYRNGIRTIDCLKRMNNEELTKDELRAIDAWKNGKKSQAILLIEEYSIANIIVPTVFLLIVAVSMCFL